MGQSHKWDCNEYNNGLPAFVPLHCRPIYGADKKAKQLASAKNLPPQYQI
jgi:hypothetical protein